MSQSNAAGGRATEAGMAFQAAVAARWIAGLVSNHPGAGDFELPDAAPVQVRCETGDAIDDIVVDFADGRKLFIQCKTAVPLETKPASRFARLC